MAFRMRLPKRRTIPESVCVSSEQTITAAAPDEIITQENTYVSVLDEGVFDSEPRFDHVRVDKGPRGDNGDRGEKGDTGVRGDPGPLGERGQQGDRGEKGERGGKGEQGNTGNKGDPGTNGEQGAQGRAASKVVLWNGTVELLTTTPEHVCTIPYDGSMYSLSNLDLVVSGKGMINVSLKDFISGAVVCEGEQDLGDKDLVHVLSTTTFNNLRSDHTVLTLNMNSGDSNTAKVLAAEFSM
jgi:hypothetical protein